jgi:hypothetical protein
MNIVSKLLIVSVFTLSASANAELIGHWSGDGNTNDSLGNNNGVLINDATYGQGLVNEAFSFDGAKDSVYLGTGLDVTDAFTLSAWFNLAEYGGARQIFNNENAYEIEIQGSELKVALRTSDVTNWYWISTGWEVNINEWTYVSMVYDGASIRLYDGDGDTRFQVNYTGMVANGSEARIGARSYNNSSFKGLIDEVSLYDEALTPGAIALQNPAFNITASVPLPATGVLFAIGLLGFGVKRKVK